MITKNQVNNSNEENASKTIEQTTSNQIEQIAIKQHAITSNQNDILTS